jgi:cell division transport system permease protein
MKKLIFLIKKGFVLFRRNIAINLITITTIATIFFVYNILFILGFSSNKFLENLAKLQTIRAFINEEQQDVPINNIVNGISKLEAVKDVKYYSSKDAFEYMKEQLGNSREIERIPKDLFPSFIEITLKNEYTDIDYVKEFQKNLDKYEIFTTTSYGEKWVINFLTIKFGIQLFMFIISLLITISVASIIYNTIKINLSKHKMEVMVYSLVGATKSFIVIPYVVCTLFEVFISFIVAYFTAFIIFYLLNSKILDTLSINILNFPPFTLVGIILTVILFIAAFSSLYSLGVFLDNAKEYNE